MEEILAAFARHESPILVGTQMLSKGHHFPDVTLAIVADGDLGLNLPDYRAAERSFQLLVQSAGRAGRGDKPGRVLIQTRNTNHYCWQYVQSGDYEGFYACRAGPEATTRLSAFRASGVAAHLLPCRRIPAVPRRWGCWPFAQTRAVSWACACWGLSGAPGHAAGPQAFFLPHQKCRLAGGQGAVP